MRWPPAGSSPVVSVSTTISRILPPPPDPAPAAPRQGAARFGPAQESEDLLQLSQRASAAEPGQHDKISPAALFAVGRLGRKDRPQARIGHSATARHPLPLQPS